MIVANQDSLPAEVEIKIELTEGEYTTLPAVLSHLSFTPSGTEALHDYYLHYARAPQGGYNFLRLRAVDDTGYFRTEKRWSSDTEGHPLRLEDETALTAEAFNAMLAAAHDALSLQKFRTNFHGTSDGRPATISLDRLQFPRQTRYFLECEVMTPPEEAHAAREAIHTWMQAHLPVADLHEAPSMLELLLALGNEAK